MIAGLAAGIHRTLLLVLEKLNQLRYGRFFDAEAFLTRMFDHRRIVNCAMRIVPTQHAWESAKPGRLSDRDKLEEFGLGF